MAMFLGTISPSKTCSNTTMDSEITKATVCVTAAGAPNSSKGRSSRCATAGSPTRPNKIEQIVIPS
ncbi:Uncharacterised protein [Mycobacteroides abscessus subsp. abscessus]|nr:Uncharacterised protein [Mycobacteroides abscessus subsp. abscessus]